MAFSTFQQNTVGNQGGAVAIRQSNVSITDSSFSDNQAVWNDSSAGALALTALCNLPLVSDNNNYAFGQLTNNIFGCALSIVGSKFTRNSAVLTGGAIYAVLDGFIIMTSQSRFEGNQLLGDQATPDAEPSLAAKNTGGGTAVALYPFTQGVGLSQLLIVSQTTFSDNTGASLHLPQAALAVQQLACLAIQDSLFHNNSAAKAGALYVSGVDGETNLCSSNVETLPSIPGLILHGAPLFDPFLSKPNHKPKFNASAPASPPLALTVDIRGTKFSGNTAFSSNAGEFCTVASYGLLSVFVFCCALCDAASMCLCGECSKLSTGQFLWSFRVQSSAARINLACLSLNLEANLLPCACKLQDKHMLT